MYEFELAKHINEIKESLITKILDEIYKTNQIVILNIFKAKDKPDFKTKFEVSDEIKKTYKQNLLPIIKEVNRLIEIYKNSKEHMKVIIDFLSPRLEFLFLLAKLVLKSEYEYQVEKIIYNDIVNFLFEKNKKLAYKEALKIKVNDLEYEDVLQSALTGLLTGIRKYNFNSGYKLSTYVVWWIKQSIYSLINQNFDLTIPERIKSVYKELLKISKKDKISMKLIDYRYLEKNYPNLVNKYPRDVIFQALKINWSYSIDYEYENGKGDKFDNDRNPIIDTYSIKNHKDFDEGLSFKNIITKLRQVLNPNELYLLLDNFNLDKYLPKEEIKKMPNTDLIHKKTYRAKIRKIIEKIRSNVKLMKELSEMAMFNLSNNYISKA